jgi:hypothetical protein
MRRPTPNCLDCGQALEPRYNYCPHCGQENNDRQLGLKTLIGDFLSNYFAVDSKLGRSVQHFFFRPGHLTRRFNEGKRVRYIHPMRLYLVISVLFFFLLSTLLSTQLQTATLQAINQQPAPAASINTPATDSKAALATPVSSDTASEKLSAETPSTAAPAIDQDFDFQDIILWMKDETLTDEMVMDSLMAHLDWAEVALSSPTDKFFFHQSRRVVQKDLDVFIPYILKNLPVMMFLLLPLFAAYLMFLFRNKPNLYISHIIHALHIHAMAFLLLSLFLLIGWFSDTYFFWSIFFLITLYAFLSVKKVYQQGWRRTGLKFLALGFLYFNSLLIFVVLELTWSFITF